MPTNSSRSTSSLAQGAVVFVAVVVVVVEKNVVVEVLAVLLGEVAVDTVVKAVIVMVLVMTRVEGEVILMTTVFDFCYFRKKTQHLDGLTLEFLSFSF